MADEDLFLSRMRALGVEPLAAEGDRKKLPEEPLEDEAPATVSEEEKSDFLTAMQALEVTPSKGIRESQSVSVYAERSSSLSAGEETTPRSERPVASDSIAPVEQRLFLEAMASLDSPPDKDRTPTGQQDRPSRVIKLKTPKRGSVKADDILDLHGLTVEAAVNQLEGFITASQAARHKVVQVITGKGHHSRGGLSVLREAVLTWICRRGRARIEAYSEAPPAQGGRGALFLYLRRQDTDPSV